MVYLYKLSALYASLLKLLGYERGIGRFIDKLTLDCPKHLRILDVGCGSGIVGLQFLERYPGATLLATDLEPNFLKETLATARHRGIEVTRVEVGVSDISEPHRVRYLDGRSETLSDKSFDIVTVGGVMGYSKDQKKSIKALLRLIKPGGYLINLEMNESVVGKFVATTYKCRAMPLAMMCGYIEGAGHRVTVVPFTHSNFPANLTRIGIVARVSASEQDQTPDVSSAHESAPPYGAESDLDYSM